MADAKEVVGSCTADDGGENAARRLLDLVKMDEVDDVARERCLPWRAVGGLEGLRAGGEVMIDGRGWLGAGGVRSAEGRRDDVWIHIELSGDAKATRRDGPAGESMDQDAI